MLAFGVLGLTVAVILLSLTGYVFAIAATAPDLSELKPQDKGETSVIYAADGSRLGFVQSDEIRTPIPWDEMTRDLRDASVAIEDERFYEHKGVDYSAIVRAGVRNLESGETVEGGSTITQQLVRASTSRTPSATARKIREAKLASELEQERSKRWILKNYLNDVPYGTLGGRTAIGIEAAAETFFDKHARDLTLPEAALLAGMPQAPSRYNPFHNPAAAVERRNDVLDKMAENRMLTREETREAGDEAAAQARHPLHAPARALLLRLRPGSADREVRRGRLPPRRAGCTPPSTRSSRTPLAAPSGQLANYPGPTAAIVSVDPATGYIRAMASSGTYRDRTFNLAAQGHRQPGSLQDDGSDHRHPQGHRPHSHHLRLQAARHEHRRLRAVAGQDVRQHVRRHDEPGHRHAEVGQHGLRPADHRRGPEGSARDGQDDGHQDHARRPPRRGSGRPSAGRLAARDGQRVRHARGRRRPQRADRDQEGRVPGRQVGRPGQAEAQAGVLRRRGLRGDEDPPAEHALGHGDPRQHRLPRGRKTGTTDEDNDAWLVGYTPKLATATWMGYNARGSRCRACRAARTRHRCGTTS